MNPAKHLGTGDQSILINKKNKEASHEVFLKLRRLIKDITKRHDATEAFVESLKIYSEKFPCMNNNYKCSHSRHLIGFLDDLPKNELIDIVAFRKIGEFEKYFSHNFGASSLNVKIRDYCIKNKIIGQVKTFGRRYPDDDFIKKFLPIAVPKELRGKDLTTILLSVSKLQGLLGVCAKGHVKWLNHLTDDQFNELTLMHPDLSDDFWAQFIEQSFDLFRLPSGFEPFLSPEKFSILQKNVLTYHFNKSLKRSLPEDYDKLLDKEAASSSEVMTNDIKKIQLPFSPFPRIIHSLTLYGFNPSSSSKNLDVSTSQIIKPICLYPVPRLFPPFFPNLSKTKDEEDSNQSMVLNTPKKT